jgi:hypothetical protein
MSLRGDTMNTRRNNIVQQHDRTCKWIFKEDLKLPWDSFSRFLKGDDKVYWTNGKAGSGKSTLVKFLVTDPRTKDTLESRAPNPLIISCFIWNAGAPMQRNIKGMLYLLLHQILDSQPDLVACLLKDHV